MARIDLILTVAAFVLFILACYPVPTRYNLIAAGLAALTATLLF